MQGFIEFIKAWAEAIINAFKEHPFSAAIMTIVAVILFVHFVEWPIKDWKSVTLTFFCVLIGWLTCVSILGWFFWLLGFVAQFLAFLYERYERQPILFIVLTLLAVASGAVWVLAFRRRGPSVNTKIGIVSACWFVGILVLVPVVDVFWPSNTRQKSATIQSATGAYI